MYVNNSSHLFAIDRDYLMVSNRDEIHHISLINVPQFCIH